MKHHNEGPTDNRASESEERTDIEAIDVERKLLADRLRETREFLGMSQQDVAEAAGVSVGLTRLAISAIETGRRKVESVELAALARLYGQPISYFLHAKGNATAEPEEVRFIARAASNMTPEDREELLRFAEFLKSYKAPGRANDVPQPRKVGSRGKR
jgi:transcriptional regulator with XRE-family HTH domain